MNCVLKSEQLNKELFKLYKGQWANIEKILKANPQLSYPQLIRVPDYYTTAEVKLMIVGKQPNRWGFSKEKRDDMGSNSIEIIERLRKLYSCFMSLEHGNNTLFWKAARKLNEKLNYNPPRDGFLWSNLIKIDAENCCPNRDVEKKLCGLRLLQEEIRITQPDVVVFFTGPDYDDRIRQDFEDMESDWKREFDTLRHKLLPPNSFRTYHPGYPKWKRRCEIIGEIADLVKKPD